MGNVPYDNSNFSGMQVILIDPATGEMVSPATSGGETVGGATAAKQDTGNTTLASILAKIIAAPATEASLAAVLAKIIAAPATEAKQDTGNTSLSRIAAGYTSANITTSTTTVVKSGAGGLHSITVNTLGTVASTVTIYDNTAGSGTKLGTINSLTLSGFFQFDVAFATGLTIVTTGAPDITVAYR